MNFNGVSREAPGFAQICKKIRAIQTCVYFKSLVNLQSKKLVCCENTAADCLKATALHWIAFPYFAA